MQTVTWMQSASADEDEERRRTASATVCFAQVKRQAVAH